MAIQNIKHAQSSPVIMEIQVVSEWLPSRKQNPTNISKDRD